MKGCLFIAVSLMALLGLAECDIKCYVCNSMEDANCDHPDKHKMATQQCVPQHLVEMKTVFERTRLVNLVSSFDVNIHSNSPNYKPNMNCLKLVAKGHDNKDVVVRGCQLAAAENYGDVCRKVLKDKKDDVRFCKLCNENACNTAASNWKILPLLLVTSLNFFKGLIL